MSGYEWPCSEARAAVDRVSTLADRIERWSQPTGWRKFRYIIARDVPTLNAAWFVRELRAALSGEQVQP